MFTHSAFPAAAIVALVISWLAPLGGQTGTGPFDLVIAGGRVIDPESGLDATRHLGVRGDRIVAVSDTPLQGRETLDASGLVVAPGFIDLHRHAHGDQSYRYAARDGVTSVFELEIGAQDVDAWYRGDRPGPTHQLRRRRRVISARACKCWVTRASCCRPARARGPATPDQVATIVALVDAGLATAAWPWASGPAYTPGASAEELAAVFRAGRLAWRLRARAPGRRLGAARR